MNKLNKKNNGFTTIETLLVLIFIALLVLIGLYVYHNHNSSKTTNTSTTTKTSVNDVSLISQRLKAIYDYANGDSASFTSGIFTNDYYYLNNLGYLTASFYKTINGNQLATVNLIQCQAAADNSSSYGTPNLTNNNTKATTIVTEQFTGMPDQVITTDWIKNGSSWQLNNVTCP